MSDSIQFYFDEHLPRALSIGLRRRGIKVLTTQEAGRSGVSDVDQLAFATAEDHVFVTFDTDFLAIHETGVAHGGIVWCGAQKYSLGELIQALLVIHGVLTRDDMRNHVEHL